MHDKNDKNYSNRSKSSSGWISNMRFNEIKEMNNSINNFNDNLDLTNQNIEINKLSIELELK